MTARRGTERNCFNTTHWSVVLQTAQADPDRSQEAWNRLAQGYWPPVYAFIRHRGYCPEDAEDLTQDFFLGLIGKQAFKAIVPETGRFRSYLLVCLNHFLIGRFRRSRAACRQPEQNCIPIDLPDAEAAFHADLVSHATPESLFEYQWAVALLNSAFDELKKHYIEDGKAELYECLAPYLLGEGEVSYAELGAKLQITEAAVKTAVYRIRQRFRFVFKQAVAATVKGEEVEAELKHLFSVLSG